jgi:U3 small nucleolar RNA-associated protein 23
MFTVDAQMIQDTDRFQMDLVGGLERTLHGKIKPSMSEPVLLSESAAATSID